MDSTVTRSDTSRLFCLGYNEEYGAWYSTVTSEEDLTARVHGAIESHTRQPHLLGLVHEAQHRRCRRLCNDVASTQFEPRL